MRLSLRKRTKKAASLKSQESRPSVVTGLVGENALFERAFGAAFGLHPVRHALPILVSVGGTFPPEKVSTREKLAWVLRPVHVAKLAGQLRMRRSQVIDTGDEFPAGADRTSVSVGAAVNALRVDVPDGTDPMRYEMRAMTEVARL